jgi:hypothetical protein
MPFTPFHFGPGLLLKGVAARWFSWSAFVAAQVVIDCESLYFLVTRQHPVHRALHTFVGATLAGCLAAGILFAIRRIGRRVPSDMIDEGWLRKPSLEAEVSPTGIWAGALAGALTHPLLDGIMHADMSPFLPLTAANPLLGALDLGTLHVGCLVAGGIGLVLFGVWLARETR